MAGFLLSSAFLAKAQALLFLVGLFGSLSLYLWRGKIKKREMITLAFTVIALLLPIFVWWFYRYQSLQELLQINPALYSYAQGKEWHTFTTDGSGVSILWNVENWHDLWRHLQANSGLRWRKLREIFSVFGVLSSFFASLAPLLAVVLLICNRKQSIFQFLGMALVMFLLWAFFLNNNVFTHQVLPGVWLLILLVGLWLSRYVFLLVLLVCVNAVVLVSHIVNNSDKQCFVSRDAACVYIGSNPMRQSFSQALNYLETHTLPMPMANCGYFFAQDIEFALPGVNNIRDCQRIFDSAVEFDRNAFISVNHLPERFRTERSTENLITIYVNKRKNLFGGDFVAPIIWRKPVSFIFVAGAYMAGGDLELRRNVMSFLEYCKDVLWRDQFYSIQRCSAGDLQDYVKAWGGLPIVTHTWEAMYYADFMQTTRVLHKSPVHMRPY